MSMSAQQAEASKIPVTVEWRDQKWTAPAPADWPWEVLEAVDDEKFARALKALLDPKQYAAFKKLRPTVTDGGELLEALVKGAGFDGSGE
jgi:hypothetical protein